MQFSDFVEIFVCILAVYGVYAFICRFLAHGCYKGDLAVAWRAKSAAAADPATVADGIRRARFLTEGQRGSMLPSVILLPADMRADADLLAELQGECDVYIKMT